MTRQLTGQSCACRYEPITYEQFAALPFPAAPAIANMYAYFSQWSHWSDVRPLSGAIVKGASFADWAAAHKEQLIAKITA